jgi:hypothetical protein
MTNAPAAAGESAPASRTIQIEPVVALNEQASLAGYWQNRAMALAQQLHDARQALEKANAALASLEVAKADDTKKKG